MRKDTYIRIRISQDFKRRLEDLADAQNVNVSRFVREVLRKSIHYREGIIANGGELPRADDNDEEYEL